MTTTWPANMHSIEQLYSSLDDEFKALLKTNGCSLFRLHKLRSSDIDLLTPLVDILLSHYHSKHHVFIFGSHRLRITLEDVLFITGLPISGKPVITSNSRDSTDAFRRIFGPKSNGKSLTMMQLKSYATNKRLSEKKRMIAVLLYVISCFITPTSSGSCPVKTTYVEFVENLVDVDSYAWGAALLAFLYTGINKWKDDQSHGKTKLSIDGNVWLLLCFFFVRIPKLMPAVGVELDMIVEKVRIVSKNLKSNYKKGVVNILNNLSDEDIRWLPYDSSSLPLRLKDQYRFRALVAPLFCNNYVVHHRPQLVPKQFGSTEGSLAGFRRYDYEIKIKHSKGRDNPDYLTFYEKEIELWEEGKQLQDFISGKRSADVAEFASPSSKKSKFDVFHEQVARELAEKIGTLTRLSKEENQDEIRGLESKIQKSEAREEKLNSELRAALERNARFQGEVESSEAPEKKLKSELCAALERNEILQSEIKSSEAREEKHKSELTTVVQRNLKLEGEIKSSEAREKKFMYQAGVALERNANLHKSSEAREEKFKSELRAAREMNVKLEGEITILEDREKKLKSEARAAQERNVILQGEITSSEGGQKTLMSNVRVVLERNVKIEDKIKNSEAREEKLNSELRVARERNVMLEGEIKSSEAREEKLKSEVRAAAERIEKIKHAVSSLV